MQENTFMLNNEEIKQEKNSNDLNINNTQIEKSKFESNIEMISKSRNYISKANFFSKSVQESQSDNSNDDTSYLTNKTSSHNRNLSNKNNPLIS